MTTNEFERDLEDQAGLKRPGRIDLRVLQNTADAGDGNPGVQRCFRNYLHEGGIEKDIQLLGFSIKGTSVNINNAEMQQLGNIGTKTISNDQWGYLGDLDQPLHQSQSPTFVGLTLSADVVTTSTFDGVNVGDLKSAFDALSYYTQAEVDTQIGNHAGDDNAHHEVVVQTDLHAEGHILSGGDHTASGLTVGYVIRASGATTFAWAQLGHGDLGAKGSNAHSVIDTHLGSTSNPHAVTLDQAFDGGKIITGATSEANAFRVGQGTDQLRFWCDGSHGYITNPDGNLYINSSSENTASIHLRTGTVGGTVKFQAATSDRWTFNNFDYTLKVHANNSYELGEDDVAFKNIYSYEFTDKSKFPDKEVLNDLSKIKTKDGKLDHSTLPDDLKSGTGRSLGANISYNTKAIQELLEKINSLEEKIIKLEEK